MGLGLRILIVEDDFLIALHAEMTLVDAGHEVIDTIATEDEAVAAALEEQPDVILLDLKLAREGCGRRVAERLRADDGFEGDIVFASGNLTPSMREQLAALDPIAMLGKPYLDTQLLGAVGLAA